MNGRLVWDRDDLDWPHPDASRFVDAAGLKWHVQIMGQGPVVLFIHGTGASTHSWRRLMPLLSHSFKIVAPDLPGHGFTTMPEPRGLSLPGMSEAVSELMKVLALEPALAVGHSAGAAVAIRATIDRRIAPRTIVSINGALLPFGSQLGQFFSPLAKLLVSAPMVPQLMAWRAQSRRAVEKVLLGTGSQVAPEDIDLYARLFRSPCHVAGALGMMANWDLQSFARDLPQLKATLVLVTASNDRAIAPEVARRVARLVPNATMENLEGSGHLAHEERPDEIAEIIFKAAPRAAMTFPHNEASGCEKRLH
jgi:magnesium chelatase accessory protein